MTRLLAFPALLAACWLAIAAPAAAHRGAATGPKTGLSIPSVTHGQMEVLAGNRAAILALADVQYPTDETMRRLQGYVSLQSFYCAWGLFPGGTRDETSPFNECSHAYLAGLRALLLHLQTMPGGRGAAQALGRKVDVEMLARHAAMVLCQFSDEPFNTADVIIPHLGAILSDPTSLAVLAAIGLMAMLGGAAAAMLERMVRGWKRAPAAAQNTGSWATTQ